MSDYLAHTPPQSYLYLSNAPIDNVRYEWLIAAGHDYIAWKQRCGLQFTPWDPKDWVHPGDLQNLATVVDWWPKNAPARMRAPKITDFLDDLIIMDPGDNVLWSFKARLDWHVERVREWLRREGGNLDNPNETREERAKRKNRERQAAWQARNRKGSDDPEHDRLITAARLEAQKLTEWKAYARKYIKDQKLECDAAVRAAKQLRDDNIKAAEQAIVDQEKRMLEAKALADAYRINK